MDLRGGSSTSTDGVSNGGTYHDHELRSHSHFLERTLVPPERTRLVLTWTYRVSRMRSYTSQRNQSTYSPCAKRLSLLWPQKGGRRQRWARCGSSIAFCASHSGTTAFLFVRFCRDPFPHEALTFGIHRRSVADAQDTQGHHPSQRYIPSRWNPPCRGIVRDAPRRRSLHESGRL